jgi:PAS domain S-box-containing protein
VLKTGGSSLESPQRLATLAATGLVESAPEEAFDRLTRLARRVVSAPLAIISLIGADRHHLASVQGSLRGWTGRHEIPLPQSICRHVVTRGKPLAIEDTHADPLLHDAPGTDDLEVGAYLGVPLTMPDGEVLGALAVMDAGPRAWSDDDVAALEEVGQAVIAEIKLRLPRQAAAREDSLSLQPTYAATTTEILESMDEAFYAIDRDWRLLYVNRGAERFWGKPREELLGESMLTLFPKFYGSHAYRAHLQALQGNEPLRVETISTATGVPVELNLYPSPSGLSIFFRDISARQEMERALRDRDEKLTLAEQSAGVGIWDLDLATGMLRATPQFFHIMGLAPAAEPVPIETTRNLRHPEDREGVLESFEEALSAGSDYCETEYRIIRPDGETRWIFGRGRVIRDAGGVPVRYSGIDIDVTERKRAEQALRESEARFRLTADSAPAFIWMADTQGVATFLNKQFASYLGISAEARIELTSFMHADDQAPAAQALSVSLSAGQPFSIEARFRRHDGEWRWFRCEAAPRFDDERKVLGLTGCNVDITETRRAAELLKTKNVTLRERVKRESAERERAVRDRERFWELSQDLFAVISNVDGKPRLINAKAWERALGYPAGQLMETRFISLIHPDDLKKTMDAADELRRGAVYFGLENRYRHADGSWRWLSWNVINDEDMSYAVARDVTAEKAREDALRRSQKLEALGQLTGGVAHDFNNLLTVIMGALDLVQKRSDPAVRERLIAAALQAARKGERLNRQLLGFARRRAVHEEFVLPARTVDDMRPLILGALNDKIALRIEATARDRGCRMDLAQFEAALLNLVVNARQAMPEGGNLRIMVRPATADELHTLGLTERDYIAIDVSDTGCGMSAEVLAHAFEPFFTTKEIGSGTGLGLAQVYGFARQSRGAVDLRSAEDIGTTVSMYLPVATAEPDEAAAGATASRSRHRRRVLLVEDDALVGVVTESMLADLGHAVTRAEDAEQALIALERSDFDLLLTDIRMPGRMNGVELARQATRMKDGLQVLLCSGWAADALGAEISGVDWPLLQKPFGAEQLERAVNETFQA